MIFVSIVNETENIQYRIKRTLKTYNDAIYLLDTNSTNSGINKLYYATIALLFNEDIEVKSHDGVKLKPGEEFVINNTASL